MTGVPRGGVKKEKKKILMNALKSIRCDFELVITFKRQLLQFFNNLIV